MRSILTTSQQGRLNKTYCQLVKSPWNFVEHFICSLQSAYIQIQMDFNIEHVYWLLLWEKYFTLVWRHGFFEYPRWRMTSVFVLFCPLILVIKTCFICTGWKIIFALSLAPSAKMQMPRVQTLYLLWCELICKCFQQCLLKDIRWLMRRYFTTLDVILSFNHGITKMIFKQRICAF